MGHALALQKAEAEAEAEASQGQGQGQQQGEEEEGPKGVTAAIGRMMLNWGLTGADSFVVVDRAAATPSPNAAAAVVEKKAE